MSFSTKITKIGTNLKVFNQSADSITPTIRHIASNHPLSSIVLRIIYIYFFYSLVTGANYHFDIFLIK